MAGVAAADAEPDPGQKPAAAKRGMRTAAKDRNLELSDEMLEKMSKLFGQASADATIEQLEQRGAFESPPEPVNPPPQPVAPPAPGEPASQASGTPTVPAQGPPAAPPRRTFAQRFMGQ
jgi:hypothetical protein